MITQLLFFEILIILGAALNVYVLWINAVITTSLLCNISVTNYFNLR